MTRVLVCVANTLLFMAVTAPLFVMGLMGLFERLADTSLLENTITGAVLLAASGVAAVANWLLFRATERMAAAAANDGRCPHCGYQARHAPSERRPECGAGLDDECRGV